MADPLAPPRQIKRLVIFGSILVCAGGLLGAAWYLHRQQGVRLQAVVHESTETNGVRRPLSKEKLGYTPARATNGTDPNLAMLEEMARLRKEMEALKAQKVAPAVKPPVVAPSTPRERSKAIYVVNEQKPPALLSPVTLYTLAVWEYLPCVLENVVSSEIPSTFTVKLTRPVLDSTRQQILLPQGQRVGAKAETAALLLGNERIPTFALSVQLPNGRSLALGDAPILDAAGTNGLTGEVNNHWWRIVWTSLAIEGLRAGQQVLTQEIASQGDGVTVTGIGQHSTNIAHQRLGRAQDTRPTITAKSGELCNILIPQAMELPSFAKGP